MTGLFKPDLFDLIDRNPSLGAKIVFKVSQVLATRLRHTNELLKRIQEAKELPVANGP